MQISRIIEFTKYIYQIALEGEFRKINEASYSEVYIQEHPETGESKIYKIIPFGNEELNQAPIQDIIQELSITNLVMDLKGYADVLEVAVVKGKYPKHLMKVCNQFCHETGVSRIHPELFQTVSFTALLFRKMQVLIWSDMSWAHGPMLNQSFGRLLLHWPRLRSGISLNIATYTGATSW